MYKSVLVLGSTGLVGSHLVEELINNDTYQHIILINRKPCGIKNEKITEFITDFSNFDFLDEIIPIHTIFSCLGTTKKKTPLQKDYEFIEIGIPKTIINKMLHKGLLHSFHIVSAIGANSESKNFYLKLKGNMEQQLSELEVKNKYFYRPAFILGDRKEKRFSENIIKKIAPLLDKLLTKKTIKYHSIPAKNIAKSMVYNDLNMFIEGTHILEYNEMQLGI